MSWIIILEHLGIVWNGETIFSARELIYLMGYLTKLVSTASFFMVCEQQNLHIIENIFIELPADQVNFVICGISVLGTTVAAWNGKIITSDGVWPYFFVTLVKLRS